MKPLPLVKDGDLVALAQYMIRTRGRETVRVTKVKGHADDSDVQLGGVRLEDQLGAWVVFISLKLSLMQGVSCSRYVVVGTPRCAFTASVYDCCC